MEENIGSLGEILEIARKQVNVPENGEKRKRGRPRKDETQPKEGEENAVREQEEGQKGEGKEVIPQEGTTPSSDDKPVEATYKEIGKDDLKKFKVKGKVNGEEKEYTFEDLLRTAQTFDAAQQRLNEAKRLEHELREEMQRFRDAQKGQVAKAPEEPVTDAYTDPYEKSIAETRKELEELKREMYMSKAEKLQSAEDDAVAKITGNLPVEQVQEKLGAYLAQNPEAREAFVLFQQPPKNQQEMNARIGFFRTVWLAAKSVDTTTDLKAVQEQAKAEGKVEAVREIKKGLTATGASSPPPSKSRKDELRESVAQGRAGEVAFARKFFVDRIYREND